MVQYSGNAQSRSPRHLQEYPNKGTIGGRATPSRNRPHEYGQYHNKQRVLDTLSRSAAASPTGEPRRLRAGSHSSAFQRHVLVSQVSPKLTTVSRYPEREPGYYQCEASGLSQLRGDCSLGCNLLEKLRIHPVSLIAVRGRTGID